MDYEQLYRQLLAQQQMGAQQGGNMGYDQYRMGNQLQPIMQQQQQQYKQYPMNLRGDTRPPVIQSPLNLRGDTRASTVQPVQRPVTTAAPVTPVRKPAAWETNHNITPTPMLKGIDRNRWGAIKDDWWTQRNKMQAVMKPTTPQYHQNATI